MGLCCLGVAYKQTHDDPAHDAGRTDCKQNQPKDLLEDLWGSVVSPDQLINAFLNQVTHLARLTSGRR